MATLLAKVAVMKVTGPLLCGKIRCFWCWVGAWRHILMLFTMIPPLWLISEQAWETHFDAIYCVPASLADLRTSLGSTF